MWHKDANHCPLCGAVLVLAEIGGRERQRCSSCAFVLYLNPAAAALGVVLNASSEVLLVRRKLQPYRGFWALPAGYQEIDETPSQAVVREIREESGVEARVLGLLDVLFVPDDPRKPANVSVFLCQEGGGRLSPGDEESEVGWFSLGALPDPIGFDNYPRILRRLQAAERYPESPWDLLKRLLRQAQPPLEG